MTLRTLRVCLVDHKTGFENEVVGLPPCPFIWVAVSCLAISQ